MGNPEDDTKTEVPKESPYHCQTVRTNREHEMTRTFQSSVYRSASQCKAVNQDGLRGVNCDTGSSLSWMPPDWAEQKRLNDSKPAMTTSCAPRMQADNQMFM